jgi:HD-like signal output (HDOD) protein
MDPVLTGKVLQLVNSAYYGLAQKITSLNRALVYLGMNTVKNLALSTALLQAIDVETAGVATLIKPVWRHSLASAVCTKGIAQMLKVQNPSIEEYFIAGLLHEIGKIILIQAFYDSNPHTGNLTEDEEKIRYGLSHTQLGHLILKSWNFPDELTLGVRDHHNPETQSKIALLLHIADTVTHKLNLNVAQSKAGSQEELKYEEPSTFVPEAVWKSLGLNETEVLKELETASSEIEKAEIFLLMMNSHENVKDNG